MTITVTYDQVSALRPCAESFAAATKKVGGVKHWKATPLSFADLRAAGVSSDDLVWLALALAPHDTDVARRVRLWIADCAVRVLHIYEYPNDTRLRDAITAARAFARGEIAAADAAWAADAADAAAWAAAGAADAAWAAAGAAAGAADAAWDAERMWQFERLVARMSDPEPEDYPDACPKWN